MIFLGCYYYSPLILELACPFFYSLQTPVSPSEYSPSYSQAPKMVLLFLINKINQKHNSKNHQKTLFFSVTFKLHKILHFLSIFSIFFINDALKDILNLCFFCHYWFYLFFFFNQQRITNFTVILGIN